jgi:hypothetical protein
MKIGSIIASGLLLAVVSPTFVQGDDPKTGTSKVTAADNDALADLYEHVANAIIEIRAAEDNLVKAMLVHYHAAAQRHLAGATEKGAGRKSHLEAAAESIASIANEGDKRAQAIRQRLSNAGHYHQKDAETKEDYMFINSAEKKNLLALAKRVGQIGADAAPADVTKVSDELKTLFGKSIGKE